MTKTIFRVPDMHCTMCVMHLEGIEDELTGVRRVKADYRKQQMEVEYDEMQVSIKQIVALARELGYAATPQ
jgi:copper chaperone CopZ